MHTLLSFLLRPLRRCFGDQSDGLQGARADLLSFRRAGGPGLTGPDSSRFLLEALIYPATADAAWEPEALTLRSVTGTSDSCRILRAEVIERRRYRPAGRRTCLGAGRVRLQVELQPGMTQLCFEHREAVFGRFHVGEEAVLAA